MKVRDSVYIVNFWRYSLFCNFFVEHVFQVKYKLHYYARGIDSDEL